MQAVILAGGKGTRLRPLTYTCPKPIVPLVNKPFLVYQLELLRNHGVTDIVLALNYQWEKIKASFGDGSQFGVNIEYAIEKAPRGTAGALKNACGCLDRNSTTIVFNGDVLTDMDISRLVDFHYTKRALATLALVKVRDTSSYGLVSCNDEQKVEAFLEKPQQDENRGKDSTLPKLINAGVYVLEPEAIKEIPQDREYSFERELYPKLLQKGFPIYGFTSRAYWLDIGTLEKYSQAQDDLVHGKVKTTVGLTIR